MTTYMVFEPPEDGDDALARAERVKFVPDRFTWSAFLLTPFWMLWHRLWLAFVAYVIVVGAVAIGLRLAGVGPTGRGLILALIALLIGFEAASLRRRKLLRRGWRERGIVIGDDREAAERRFFDAFVASGVDRTPPPPAAPPPSSFRPGASASDVIGLFPQPGASR
jgi:hypothetical protein